MGSSNQQPCSWAHFFSLTSWTDLQAVVPEWHKWQVPVSLYGLTQEERDAIGYIDYHNINDNEPDDDE